MSSPEDDSPIFYRRRKSGAARRNVIEDSPSPPRVDVIAAKRGRAKRSPGYYAVSDDDDDEWSPSVRPRARKLKVVSDSEEDSESSDDGIIHVPVEESDSTEDDEPVRRKKGGRKSARVIESDTSDDDAILLPAQKKKKKKKLTKKRRKSTSASPSSPDSPVALPKPRRRKSASKKPVKKVGGKSDSDSDAPIELPKRRKSASKKPKAVADPDLIVIDSDSETNYDPTKGVFHVDGEGEAGPAGPAAVEVPDLADLDTSDFEFSPVKLPEQGNTPVIARTGQVAKGTVVTQAEVLETLIVKLHQVQEEMKVLRANTDREERWKINSTTPSFLKLVDRLVDPAKNTEGGGILPWIDVRVERDPRQPAYNHSIRDYSSEAGLKVYIPEALLKQPRIVPLWKQVVFYSKMKSRYALRRQAPRASKDGIFRPHINFYTVVELMAWKEAIYHTHWVYRDAKLEKGGAKMNKNLGVINWDIPFKAPKWLVALYPNIETPSSDNPIVEKDAQGKPSIRFGREAIASIGVNALLKHMKEKQPRRWRKIFPRVIHWTLRVRSGGFSRSGKDIIARWREDNKRGRGPNFISPWDTMDAFERKWGLTHKQITDHAGDFIKFIEDDAFTTAGTSWGVHARILHKKHPKHFVFTDPWKTRAQIPVVWKALMDKYGITYEYVGAKGEQAKSEGSCTLIAATRVFMLGAFGWEKAQRIHMSDAEAHPFVMLAHQIKKAKRGFMGMLVLED